MNENCTVMVNVLPNGVEAELPYQVVNALVSGTVISAEASVVPVGEVKWNNALVILRGVERPVTERLNPLVVTAPGVTPVMTGTVGLTMIVFTIGAELSDVLVVIVIIPATVPMITGTLKEVLPARIVKLTVVPVPVPNFAS